MKFAVISDIHGNSAALDAVLADMDRLAIRDAINLGDHLSGPLDAAGTAERLMKRGFHAIRGNHDRQLLETARADMGASDRVAFDALSSARLNWLRAMPPTLTLWQNVFVCHGTPSCDRTYWLERVNMDGTVRGATLDEIEQEAKGIDADLILCGHTHIPRLFRLRDGRTVLNPGSVGCPGYDSTAPIYHKMQTGTPNASYAIAEQISGAWHVTFRSVPYDAAHMIERARAYGREEWVRVLETGRMDM